MTKILVNLVNQKGAGPKNIARQFLLEPIDLVDAIFILNSAQVEGNLFGKKFIEYKEYDNKLIRCLYYMYFYYFWLPIYGLWSGIDRYLVFGNYLHGLIHCRKRVLIHHPYLFDFRAILRSSPKIMIIELCRFFVFRLLLIFRFRTVLVVQTRSMMMKLNQSLVSRFESKIVPNPISSDLKPQFRGEENLYTNQAKDSCKSRILRLGYISRYYPHKRFDLMLEFIRAFRGYNVPFSLTVTVDEFPEDIAAKIVAYPEIINLGEVSQANLQNVYNDLDITLYFSDRETFGNTILESLMFAIPVFGLDRDYFTDFIVNHKSKLISNSVKHMAETINNITEDHDAFVALTSESRAYCSRFKDVKEWVAEMCDF